MPSVIPGYEYDIFISYRQKDNKGDHWVTEFVDALKTELEATFKEDISIYFDENPQDGLLETHDVDDSLKDKLKCLIFIPIISQTYCDPKSFAWTNEFLVFKKMASEDQFGLKVKLVNGNVAGRILSVKIHELDDIDKAIVKNELGALRSIDFVFKAPGVNRPLRNKDDDVREITHTLYYRDQINKVANAAKELIMTIHMIGSGETIERSKESIRVQSGRPEIVSQSIAVLPFTNMSSDPEQEYLCDGITEEMINTLTTSGGLRVIARTSAFTFKNSPLGVREIGNRLNVEYILEGAVRKSGDKIRLNASLIEVSNENHIWSGKFDRELMDIFSIQEEIALSIGAQLKVLFQEKYLKPQTHNLEAFNHYLQGRYLANRGEVGWQKKSVDLYEWAIAKDPKYSVAHAAIAFTLWLLELEQPQGLSVKINKHALLAIKFDNHNAEAHAAIAVSKYHNEWKWQEAEDEFRMAVELNKSSVLALHNYAIFLSNMGRGEDALILLGKAFSIDPLSTAITQTLGWCYFALRRYEQSKATSREALRLEPTNVLAKIVLTFALIELQEFSEAKEILETLSADNLFGRTCQVWALSKSGDIDKAKQIVNELSHKGTEIPLFMAWMQIAIHEIDQSFYWLQVAIDKKDLNLISMPVFSWWDPIRNTYAFEQALDITGITEYLKTYTPLPEPD